MTGINNAEMIEDLGKLIDIHIAATSSMPPIPVLNKTIVQILKGLVKVDVKVTTPMQSLEELEKMVKIWDRYYDDRQKNRAEEGEWHPEERIWGPQLSLFEQAVYTRMHHIKDHFKEDEQWTTSILDMTLRLAKVSRQYHVVIDTDDMYATVEVVVREYRKNKFPKAEGHQRSVRSEEKSEDEDLVEFSRLEDSLELSPSVHSQGGQITDDKRPSLLQPSLEDSERSTFLE